MLPAFASGATFCVHAPPECVGTEKSKLQEALNATNANGAGRDEIRIGTGLFNDGPAVDLVGNPVDLIGVASNKTAIYSSQTTAGLVILDIQEPTTEVRDLRVHHNSAAPFATGLVLAGDADDVLVTNQGLAGQFDGVRLIGGASSFDDSSVSLVYPENLQNRAIFVASGASPAITDSYLEGAVGVADSGEATILRTRIRAAQGVVASGGADTVVRDTEIRTPGPMKSNFQILGLAAAGNGATSLEADRVTAYGDGTGYGTWVVPNDGAGNNAAIALEGSVLDGFAADVRLHESGGANASLTSAYSAYDSTKLSLDAGTSHVQGTGKLDLAGVDPGFADPTAGKLWLLHDSPLVDAGDPAFQPFLGFDVLLRIRVRDGDGNGSSVVDIGAHEYQRSAPQAVATAPAGGEVGQALSFDGSESSDPDSEALTYSWSFDDGTQAGGASVQKAFATPGPHTGTLTVTDPTGLSDDSVATVTISALPSTSPVPSPGRATLVLSDLSLAPARFRVAATRAARAAKARPAPRGTRIGFTLSQAARVDFTVHRARPKRRWAKVGTFTSQGRSGANSIRWGGLVRNRVLTPRKLALPPGRYRLTARADGGNGLLSEPLRKRFKILPG